jgi:hypothetical protein
MSSNQRKVQANTKVPTATIHGYVDVLSDDTDSEEQEAADVEDADWFDNELQIMLAKKSMLTKEETHQWAQEMYQWCR